MVLGQVGLAQARQHIAREAGHEFPGQVEGGLDGAVLGLALADETLVKGVGEAQEALVALRQFIGADDGGKVAGLQGAGIEGIKLGGDPGVVLAGVVLADARCV